MVKAQVLSSGFDRRIKHYINNVENRLKEALPEVAQKLLDDVAERAPSMQEEYQAIMGGMGLSEGGGGTSVDLLHEVGMKGLRIPYQHSRPSEISVDTDGRIRFIRIPGLWLKEAVRHPATYRINTRSLTISLGVVSELNRLTKFSWQNWTKIHGTYPIKTTKYGMFRAFEFGGAFRIEPQVKTDNEREQYWLSPEPGVRVPFMVKHFYPHRMYTGLDRALFTEAITEQIRSVQF